MSKKQKLGRFLRALAQIGPFLLRTNPHTAPYADDLTAAIAAEEQLRNAKSVEAMREGVQNAAEVLGNAVNQKAGREVVHIGQLRDATGTMADAVVKAANVARDLTDGQ